MAVACPECGSEDLDLIEVLEDERRRIKCEACAHEWLRGEARGVAKKTTPVTGPKRERITYTPAEIQTHPNGPDHFVPALQWWSDEDDAYSSIAPTLNNPYCIQPFDLAFFNKGTRGHDRECYVEEHPAEVDADPKWMVKGHKPHWMALCEYHASRWTGWSHRLLHCEKHIKVFLEDDLGFEDWVSQHGGYVLVQHKKSEYMLHLGDCSHLARENDNVSLTDKPRRWAKQTAHLIEWSRENIGTEPLRCTSCM